MSAPLTSGLSVELLLRVIDVKYGCFIFLLYFGIASLHFKQIQRFSDLETVDVPSSGNTTVHSFLREVHILFYNCWRKLKFLVRNCLVQ